MGQFVEGFLFLVLLSVVSSTFISGNPKSFSCQDSSTEKELLSDGHLVWYNGSTGYFFENNRFSDHNKNPVIAKYSAGKLSWCKEDYETSKEVSEAYAFAVNPKNTTIYVVFSITGASGALNQDFRSAVVNGWIDDYGIGSTLGAPVSILALLDAESGELVDATYLPTRRRFGSTSWSSVEDIQFDSEDNLVVRLMAGYLPLRTDKTRMECNGVSPREWTVVLTPDLSRALSTVAVGCY
eukprot:TRINITY_DN1501_c0_g1_i1.p1 TRINITY_DN1501_c0_g1~~TRINITY_DN1501_c0_g1_i1.p1  ORF type:complete len:249 (-),score=58.36 TRINITY_DN1501_c0_g1_i1:31-747(-)